MLLRTIFSAFALAAFAGANPVAAPEAYPEPVADPVPDRTKPDLVPRQTIIPGGRPCGQNNATNRGCWKNNWNISTDYEHNTPPAFNTRVYDFYITNVTSWLGPDGVTKHAMLINNQFPGPTIEADWGDFIQVNVHNQLQDNGTSIHWHGIRQLGESDQDGANGVTECPIPPGHSKSYAFHVTQYGSSWYHSHFSSQYGNGIVGPMVVRGPTSANWDIDLGPYMITDYYWETADRLQRRAELLTGGPPDSDNVLFRGKGAHPNGQAAGGSFDRIVLTPGKKHLLRIINTSVDNSITVSLVDHPFLVVSNDLVPIRPVVKNQLFLGVGQRYDVIIEANRTVGNYWFNVTMEPTNLCGRSRNRFPASIFQYQGASSTANPTNRGTPITAACADETGLVPWVPRTLPSNQFNPTSFDVDLTFPTVDFRGQVFRWLVNDMDIEIDWSHPILENIYNRNNTYPPKANIVRVPAREAWTFWILQNTFLLPHPVHLHGHDFYVLGKGSGTFFPNNMTNLLNFNNPMRRDVAQMPGSGWIVIAFITDNPGCWLLHCHIAWHVSQGLGIQFLERESEIRGLMNLNQMVPNCNAWREYWPARAGWKPMLDSGLRKRGIPAWA